MSDLPEAADVGIVGGGSAGAVLAARLSQDPARSVLLLEADHACAPDASPREVLDAGILADPGHDWGYTARATDQAPGIPAARGKVLGGSRHIQSTPSAFPIAERAVVSLSAAQQGGHGLASQRTGSVRQPHDDRVLVQRGPDQPVLQRHLGAGVGVADDELGRAAPDPVARAVAVRCEVGRQQQHGDLLLGQLLRDGIDPVSRARGG
jgi:glycine/D-amino acid oxidase-like deaminating enzyme